MKIAYMAEIRVLDIVEKCTDVSSETLVAQTTYVLKEKNGSFMLHEYNVTKMPEAATKMPPVHVEVAPYRGAVQRN